MAEDHPSRGSDESFDEAFTPSGGSSAPPAVSPLSGRRRRRLRLVALWMVASLVALAMVATGLVTWTVRRSFPSVDATLDLPGLNAPVTVYRDEFGVAQIYASSEADLFRAQGYVHAQDRFWEMDFRRHVGAGRLAELFGASEISIDAFIRTLGWRRVAEQEWSRLSAQTKSYLQAYADGVNTWLGDHIGRSPSSAMSLEYAVIGLINDGYTVRPWDPIDSLAWMKVLAWDLRGNMNDELARAALLAYGIDRTQIQQLFPPYPFDRQTPIVGGGTVVDSVFAANGATGPVGGNGAMGKDGGNGVSAGPPGAAVVGAAKRARLSLSALSDAIRSMPAWLTVIGEGLGSNSWVVSGTLTASGKPLLANDPHLSPSIPGIWYQVGLHCTCSFNVVGFSMSGVPGVLIGHNDRIAWGLTNLGADVTDLYVEKLRGNQYLDGGDWRPLTVRREVIAVAGGSPVTITVRGTRHGPLLSDRSADLLSVAQQPPVDPAGSPVDRLSPAPAPSLDDTAPDVPTAASATPYGVSLRWTALEPGRTIEAVFALDRASDWSQFRAAAAMFEVPSQNLIYADVDGNIGYQAPGRIPVRGKGDGLWPAPGWDRGYDWAGYIPFTALPNSLNPSSGLVVTANQAVIGPGYPHTLTNDWAYGYRSERIRTLISQRAAAGRLTVADMRAMQFDSHNGFASTLVPALLSASANGAGSRRTLARARDLLAGWDFQQPAETPSASSAAAAIYNAVLRHLIVRTFEELPEGYLPSSGEGSWEVFRALLATPGSPWWDDTRTAKTESMNDTIASAFHDAIDELSERLGADPTRWRWGDLHKLTYENVPLGQSGVWPIEWLLNRGPVSIAGGGGTVNATSWDAGSGYDVVFIPSMRSITDLSDLDGSRWVQSTGNSGHAFHPNYADQVELWRTGQDTPMYWSRERVQAAAEHTMTLRPATTG